jgi:hypothetical protein
MAVVRAARSSTGFGGFRQLDPTTLDVVFWGDTFNISEIVAEAQRILPKETAKPHWEP